MYICACAHYVSSAIISSSSYHSGCHQSVHITHHNHTTSVCCIRKAHFLGTHTRSMAPHVSSKAGPPYWRQVEARTEWWGGCRVMVQYLPNVVSKKMSQQRTSIPVYRADTHRVVVLLAELLVEEAVEEVEASELVRPLKRTKYHTSPPFPSLSKITAQRPILVFSLLWGVMVRCRLIVLGAWAINTGR